ncbi:MAG: ABC transporter ATP-binding protein [Planctomycetes bacterium]|nr:ABC transporter ATP-binding protein [Planctomycetota bacterium]
MTVAPVTPPSTPPPSPAVKHIAGIVQTMRTSDADGEVDQRPLELRLIRRLFGFTKPYAVKRNWLFFFVILRAIQIPATAGVLAALISGPIAHQDQHGIMIGLVVYIALAMFTNITFHFRQRLALEMGEAVVHDLRNAIFEHLQRMPMSFFHRTRLGRILSRVTSDADAVRSGVQDVLFVSIVQCGQMIGAAGLMIWYDWRLFLAMMMMVPILWHVNRYFRAKLSDANRRVQESFSRVTATLAESVNGIRVTQGFVRQDINGGLFRDLMRDHARYNMGVSQVSAVFLPLLEFNSQLFIAVLLVLGGYRAFGGDIPPSTLLSFYLLSNYFFNPIPTLGNLYNQALTSMAGAERVFHLLDSKPEWSDAPDARDVPSIDGRVEFKEVTFGYDPAKPVLHGITFVAAPGQSIALVGHTGSGKSSVINLVAKFYLPTSGELLIDGREIRTITSSSLRRQMGIVLQTNFLFRGSVFDNIRVGRPTATDAEIIEAARGLDCLDLLEALPNGLATVVGEKGSGISLGQRQIICFTRAMLSDPRIIILDEATSSIDAMTELRLQHALAKLLLGRTSFVVAHRLSTIRNADQVLVLDHGRIIERGRHIELLPQGGVYAQLYRQFVRAGSD